MPVDLKTLGGKLRAFREQLRESFADVAEGTGIDERRLEAMESGATEPTGDEILILADHYRCDFKHFVSNERTTPFEQMETLYRIHGADFSKADRRAVQEFLHLCETEAFLMRELSVASRRFEHSPTGRNFKGQGEAGAKALRAHFGYEERAVPMDVYSDFRTAGAHVFRRKLGNSSVSGLFVKHPTAGPCILVNHSEDIYRQRFSAAHEMAHAVFDVNQEASVSYFGNKGRDLREVRANRFASCYLMPPDFLRRIAPSGGWNEALAEHWASRLKVSCDALGIALLSAHLVDERLAASIRGCKVPRDEKADPELPATLTPAQRERKMALLESGLSDFYVGLCFDAASAGVVSTGRLAEALLCSPEELPELSSLYGRTPFGFD